MKTNSKSKSRNLRKNSTDAERKMWSLLRNRQLIGYKFRRQHPIKKFIVDFSCPEKLLAIEVDGGQHMERKKEDDERTQFLEIQGYRVLRFWNDQVLKETESGTYYPIHITATGFGTDMIAAKKQLAKNMEFVIRARVWDDEGEALDLDNDGTYDVVRAGDNYRYPLYAEYELPEIPWNLSYVSNAKISADRWAEKSNTGVANEIRSASATS